MQPIKSESIVMTGIERYKSLPVQVRASFWFLVCTFTNKVVSVLTTPIFTRILTTSEFGEYNVYSSWLSIFTVFVSLNLSLGVFVRGCIKFENQKGEFASSMQSLTLLLTVGWLCIYLSLSDIVNSVTGLTTVRMLLIFMTIWLSAVFGLWTAGQRVDYKYRKLVPITILVSFLGQGLGILLATKLKDKVTGRILGTVIIDFLFYFWLFWSDLRKGKTLINKQFWKYALLFNLPLVPHYLSQTILNSSDRIMIEKMIENLENKMEKMQESVNKDLEKLKNKHTNNTITETENTLEGINTRMMQKNG